MKQLRAALVRDGGLHPQNSLNNHQVAPYLLAAATREVVTYPHVARA